MMPTHKMMKGLWLEDQTLSFRQNLSVPELTPGEALIKVRLAGICGTDLELVEGYYPFRGIPGHEFVGVVVESSDPDLGGVRVVGEINLTCGECRACNVGMVTHCENRSVLGIRNRNGCFAEYLTLPMNNLHPIPDSVPDDFAIFTEPLAAALEIQEQIQIHADDRVLLVHQIPQPIQK